MKKMRVFSFYNGTTFGKLNCRWCKAKSPLGHVYDLSGPFCFSFFAFSEYVSLLRCVLGGVLPKPGHVL